MVEEVDVDVAVAPDGAGGAEEDDADEKIARDLLRPGGGGVEGVAGEELVEDGGAEQPEEGHRQIVLEAVGREVDGLVLDGEFAVGAEHLGIGGHGILPDGIRAGRRHFRAMILS